MLFNSYEFLLAFLPGMLLVFAVLRRIADLRWTLAALLAGSLFFYGEESWRFLILLLGSMLGNWLAGAWLMRTRDRMARRRALVLGVVFNLGILFCFKYAWFAAAVLHDATGLDVPLAPLMLPLGISFYTFQQIAYLVDAWRGETTEQNPLRYALFVSFFPQLIAGPIVHHKEMAGQLPELQMRPFASDLAVGLSIFVIGLAKKVLLADSFALVASPIFDAAATGTSPGVLAAWTGTGAYALQIYFDFSAYSDMAIGLGRMFGIILPINFASPYKAASIVDFWRRWHITLSRFLRDYLYIPLGGNRRGPWRQRLNLFLTMLLGGIWHGAGWTFVLWGAMHGAMLVIVHLWWTTLGQRRKLPHLLAHALTLLAVVLAWVPFRAADLPTTWCIYGGLVGLGEPGSTLVPAAFPMFSLALEAWLPGVDTGLVLSLLLLAAGWGLALAAPNTQTLMRDFSPGLPSPGYATGIEDMAPSGPVPTVWRPTRVRAVAFGCLLAFCVLSLGRASEFIYFHF